MRPLSACVFVSLILITSGCVSQTGDDSSISGVNGDESNDNIPTWDLGHWNRYKDEYVMIDSNHYSHPGVKSTIDDGLGLGWKDGYYLTVQGNGGSFSGAGMQGGTLTFLSDVYDNTGYNMSDGKIIVRGNANNAVGFEMNGGSITIDGDCKRLVGWKMKGGKVSIRGNAGDNIGENMQGGEIEIFGGAGNTIGYQMFGGDIIIHADAGNYAGADMKGGSITIDGKAGNNIGNRMENGIITVNCNNVVSGETCAEFIGAGMKGGKIYIKGKAEVASISPIGGEIWEYWGTSQQTRLFPS